MGTARIDHVSLLNGEEEFGVFIRLTRRARVVGLSDIDYNVLWDALQGAGIPAVGSNLAGDNFVDLVLTKRRVSLLESDPTKADVDLTYEHILNEGQDIDAPPHGLLLGKISCAINQTTSNLDKDGDPISVQYMFPADDPDFPGQTQIQGGEIQYFQPQVTAKYVGIMTTDTPWNIARGLVGKLNSVQWSLADPGEWMCTSVTWEFYGGIGDTGASYKMTFEFQNNPDTWDPTVVFIDPRTGKPPHDLISGVGYKQVPKHDRVDFEAIVGVPIQGG